MNGKVNEGAMERDKKTRETRERGERPRKKGQRPMINENEGHEAKDKGRDQEQNKTTRRQRRISEVRRGGRRE